MKNTPSSFYALVSVFFFWGFVAASNGVFIPFCKKRFLLSQFESQLIDTAFYLAYFVGSFILFFWNKLKGYPVLEKFGYKKGVLAGLLISILGSLSMIPALHQGSFSMILAAFFIIGLGFSLQQTTSQPFVLALGEREKGAFRLNFAGGINSLGTLLGPLIVASMLFGSISAGKKDAESADLASIDTLYIFLAIILALAFLVLWAARLPKVEAHEKSEKGSALRYPALRWGMLAIFVYVGVEVTIQSNLGQLLKQKAWGGFHEDAIDPFIAVYWGSLMIGRWTGAINAFHLNRMWQNFLLVLIPLLAFGVIMAVNEWKGNDMTLFLPYMIPIALLIFGSYFTKDKPEKMLTFFAAMGMVAMLTGMLTTGTLSIFAFLSGGLACSIMWPCIFDLSLKKLGADTGEGSALLIMMILGGAVIPPLQGWMADQWGILLSYGITVMCFAYLFWFGLRIKKWNGE